MDVYDDLGWGRVITSICTAVARLYIKTPLVRYDCGVGRHGRIHGRMSPSYYGLFYISGLYDRVSYLECPASWRRRSAYEICT